VQHDIVGKILNIIGESLLECVAPFFLSIWYVHSVVIIVLLKSKQTSRRNPRDQSTKIRETREQLKSCETDINADVLVYM